MVIDIHVETRRRLVRRIPAEGLDPCGYVIDVFLFASRHLIVVCTQTYIFRYCIVFEAVVCRLYEMLYPCICNVVISCWKSGAYDFVICCGGTDMCFVPRSGWKHLDLEQYRISGLTLPEGGITSGSFSTTMDASRMNRE